MSAAATDVVLYASDVTTIHGNWSRQSDSTGAGGQIMASPDNGWSATDAPLAAPADYFEVPFNAPANTVFHVWFRLRAAGNSKYNDSVWVQYSDAISGGQPVYAIGTTSALDLNLEGCAGCGDSGWGWQDGAYWLTQAVTIQFSTSGQHTIRVQTREDGVQLDQIVLSASTYLNAAPGPIVNDATIVAKSSGSGGSTPFSGSPIAIPGTLLPENFDNGGEGVAYHDATSGNSGGQYRQTDVDIEASSGGGYDIGWVSAGEWLAYTVNVATAGSYSVAFNVAALGAGGTFHLEMNGSNVTGPVQVPNTGGWQTWQTVTASATLAAGQQIARLVMDTNGANAVGNFGPIQFTTSGSGGSGGSGDGLSPYLGSPVSIPGRVSAANFDNGGEGVAYHDATPGNAGGAYRQTDVDLELNSEGLYSIGWITAGEWVNYSVNVAAAGSYTAQLRVASPSGGGSLHIGFNSASSVWTTVPIPATGGWQTWTTVSVPVTLGAGRQLLTLGFDTGGYNVAYVDVVSASGSGGGSGSSGGATVTVPAGGDLQAAIDAANPGDTLLLVPGATYAGSFELPAKGGASYITIRSAAPDASLPADGVRITPDYTSQLPRIQGGLYAAPAFFTDPGAHHYRLQFLEIVSTYVENSLVDFGDGSSAQTSLSTVAHDLIIDRCYLHGDPSAGQKRGVSLNSASTSVINSYISDIKSPWNEAQAIGGWNGPGPYTITNNYLEAAGENIMFGGSDPTIPNLVPSDITIRQNYITKQLAWRSQGWIVKNLIELKNAQRVVIDGNVIENIWLSSQTGFAVLFTPRNQYGGAPWSAVQHLEFTNNVVRHAGGGINILGTDDLHSSQPLTDVTVRNNLFLDISLANWGGGGNGRFLQMLGGQNVTIDHNTVFTDGPVVFADSAQAPSFTYTNNIAPDNGYAIVGSGASPGSGAVAAYFPQSLWLDNVFAGSNAATYPTGNYYPASLSAVGFVNQSGGNYRLASSSLYVRGGTDGTDVGCNIDALNQAAKTTY